MKATFFMTYIMLDGWAGIASEILRLKPLVIYHLKNMFLVKTEKDREKAMDPGSIGLPETIPTLQLYFLLGLVYAVVTPLLLPFILVFFAFAFLVYRHQVSTLIVVFLLLLLDIISTCFFLKSLQPSELEYLPRKIVVFLLLETRWNKNMANSHSHSDFSPSLSYSVMNIWHIFLPSSF